MLDKMEGCHRWAVKEIGHEEMENHRSRRLAHREVFERPDLLMCVGSLGYRWGCCRGRTLRG